MNILYFNICSDGLTEQKVNKLHRIIGGNEKYCVYSSDKVNISNYKCAFNFNRIIKNDYSEYNREFEVSVDDILLNAMSKYDLEIFYMYKRLPFKYRNFELCKNSYLDHIKFWNNFLTREKIKYVVFSTIPHEICDYIVYRLCQVYNISVCISDSLNAYDTCTLRKVMINSINYNDDFLLKNFEVIKNKYTKLNIDDITLSKDMEKLFTDALKSVTSKSPNNNKIFSFSSRKKELKRYSQLNNISFVGFIKLSITNKVKFFWHFIKYIKLKIETCNLISYYSKRAIVPDYNKKYIYVPLHYTPECTSCPQGGGMYADQVLYIDILSSSIPDDVYIYVKEHPTQTAYGRDKSFYDRIVKLKNTFLIKETINSYELMRNSIAVASLTGTSGYECQLIGKPFIMFGYYISKFAPGSIQVRTIKETKKAINTILANKIRWSLKDIKIYLKFIEENSIKVYQSEDDEKHVESIYNVLVNKHKRYE